MPDIDRALDLVMQLMAIPGKSCEEGKVASFVRRQLQKAGVPHAALQDDAAHERTPRPGQSGNLILKLPGSIDSPRRLFSAHLDTVPICVGAKPILQDNLVRSANPATGLGADDRAGVAVILQAALEILEKKLPHPPLTFCWFVQEEIGLQGARVVKKALLGKPRLAFNWDGGSPVKITIGATGGYRMAIDVYGTASHAGGAPQWGVSAIAIAGLAIAELYRNGWHGEIRKGHQSGTSNIGYIAGGEATNVVTDHVQLRAEARSHDAAFRKQIVAEIEKAFQKAAKQVTNVAGQSGRVEIQGQLDYESFRLADDDPSVAAAEAAIRAIGRQPMRVVANGGVDANWLTAHGIPTATIGCGQLNQHMVSEALDVADFQDACRIAFRLATTTES